MSRAAVLEIFVPVKWVVSRFDVDPLDAKLHELPHETWFSHADMAAVETALRLADRWRSLGQEATVTAVCVGPSDADDALRELVAAGVNSVVRVDTGKSVSLVDQPSSRLVAANIAGVLTKRVTDREYCLVICGDVSDDRGSGAVPAFVAHDLEFAQALGLVRVDGQSPATDAQSPATDEQSPTTDAQSPRVGEQSPTTLSCTRRLDGGRREVLEVTLPAVISVEGSVADLRRASLRDVIEARSAQVEVVPFAVESVAGRGSVGSLERPVLHPWRPRTRVVPAPDGDSALERISELIGARSDRKPPRTVVAEPSEAAKLILDQLEEWGYEWGLASQS